MLACSSSIVVALLTRRALHSWTIGKKGAKLALANSTVAFFACGSAGFLNSYSMRSNEIRDGIDVMDPANPEVPIGIKSKIAAKQAVL